MQRQTKYKIGRINIWLIIALTCAGLVTNLSLDVSDAAATYSQRPADTTQDLPDLMFESVTLDPPNPQIGDTVKIQAVIKNQSDVFADGFTVYLYWNPTDQPPTADTEPTSKLGYNPGLIAGGTFEWGRGVEVTSSDLTYYVWIDRDNEVYESNEENNLYRYPILSPTATPTEVYLPTAIPTEGYPPAATPTEVYLPTATPTDVYPPTATPTPTESSPYQPDEYEEDDVCGDANEIATDGSNAQQHNLFLTDSDVDGDHDWVRFEAISGEEYYIVASPNGDAGSDAEINLSVIEDCEEESGGAFGGNEAQFTYTANKNGTHYIEVYHNDNDYGPKTDYTLTVTAQNACEDFYEPNNSCPRSNDLFVDKEAQLHRFCQPSDVDWMHFEGEAGLEYKVSFEEMGDVKGAQIEIHKTCEIQEPSALGPTESLQFYANSDGPIYLRLSNRDSRYGSDTEYAVQVEQVGESACGPDDYEQDDEFGTAQAINITDGNFSRNHNTCPANEADWTQFEAEKDKTYLIETTDLGQSANPVTCLYDNTKKLIECDSNSGLGNGTKLIWKATEDGTYYVEVKDEDSTVAGPDTAYTLRISTDLCGGALHEPNDNFSRSTSIQIDNSQLHTFCQVADQDWVKFEASTRKYVITARPGENGVDTVLALYDPSGNMVAENNDTSDGFGARIEYQVNSAGTYHILAYPHDPNSYGSAVEYNITVEYELSSTPTPVPTAEPTPPPTPTPTPSPSDTRTLILVNRDRLVQLYGESDTAQIEGKLEALKDHDRVRGEIIQLQDINAVSDAYDVWLANLNDVQNANRVADAIRRSLLSHLDQKGGIEYIVLVGDDRALPFRRVKDPTSNVRRDFTESQYSDYGDNHPTAAALSQDYILTDDFYIDRDMKDFYIPNMDLSIGRLIESPAQIITTIDQFLTNPDTKVERVLVTGYDFLVDSGESMCKRWQDDIGSSGSSVNCDMISQNWSGSRLRQAQQDEVYQIQSINGHALHDLEGTPDQNNVSANDIASGTSDIGGNLLYTLGCHGGLNVPGMMDLPESFISRGGTYIGNTGYGWGFRGGIGLSEQLMELLTFNLTEDVQATIGKALVTSKHQYILDQSSINAYDEKILQQVILYGLPMRRVLTGASFGATPLSERDALFTMDHTSVRASTAQNDVEISEVKVVRQSEFSDNMTNTSDGMIYSLDGQTITDPGQAIVPANYSQDVNLQTGSTMPDARSLVLKSGQYTTQQNFDPVIATAYNEYTENGPSEDAADLSTGWSPGSPMMLSRQGDSAQVISSLGQYDTATQRMRLFDELRGDIYFSDSPDTKAPRIILVSGVYDLEAGQTTIKVGVEDESGVMSVFVGWFDEESNGSGKIVTQALINESGMAGWSTSVDHDMANGFFIQAVDNTGNSSIDYNNGHYYLPSSGGIVAPLSINVLDVEGKSTDGLKVYLPVVVR